MTRRTLIATVIAGILLGLSTGLAFAYFRTTGSGSGSGKVATPQAVSVVAFAGGDAPTSLLQPGGSADVMLRLNNPNASSVTLTAVSFGSPITVDTGHAACTTTGVSFANQSALSISVPSGASLIHIPGAAAMDTTSQSACQGATFSVPVTLTVHQG